VFSQENKEKPPLETGAIENWPELRGDGDAQVTNDGRFVSYIVSNQPNPGRTTTFVQSMSGSWKRAWTNRIGSCLFSNDSKQIFLLKKNDTLCVANLGGDKEQNIPNIASFQLFEYENSQWLATQSKLPDQNLVVKNLATLRAVTFPGVVYYAVNGSNLLLLQKQKKDKTIAVNYVSLNEKSINTIWAGEQAKNFIFSEDKKKIAFIGSISQEYKNAFWYWDAESGTKKLMDETFNRVGDDATWQLDKLTGFSKDGNYIYYKAVELQLKKKPLQNAPLVDVWSYSDPTLQAKQLLELQKRNSKQYSFVFCLERMASIQLERKGEVVSSGSNLDSDDYLLLNAIGARSGDGRWNKYEKDQYSIISIRDSSKKINIDREVASPYLSPDQEYCLYFDPGNKNFISLDLNTGKESIITSNINTIWTSFARMDDAEGPYVPMGVAGWTKNKEVLIYDQNDIFLADLTGVKPAESLTGGFGRAHQIVFRLAMEPQSAKKTIDLTKKLLLCAFNRFTKEDGFFWLDLQKNRSLIELTMQPKLMKGTDELVYGGSVIPIKAKNADLYVVRIESEQQSPNLFYTTDFKKYTAITNIYPEKNYNWVTAELINWKTLDSIASQGILYKPKNFNPLKKYPLIITYYEKYSAGLHQFDLMPYSDGATIRIPEYVSNGYLVFVADIHYKMGNPGESACNTIVSAANVLAKEPWVDASHIGLNGHSFGGYETEYIIAHSGLFAAACANSGWSNFTSGSSRVKSNGTAGSYYYEYFRQRMDANMWERPDRYIKASPLFQAHNVTTPLLMMNNKEDADTHFSDGVQFFIALRRLGKKVWMLQYDNQGHVLSNRASQRDLSIRMRQFFDFYLKGTQAPAWMVRGIPAERKGFDLGYNLEPDGIVPGSNLLTSQEQKKVDSLQNRKPFIVEVE
jgi:dipeptidyl aminopeptidase/acylaminoacyl peptidase